MLAYTPNIVELDLSSNKIVSFYRNVDQVTSGGFGDALSMSKRMRAREKINTSVKSLKTIVQTQVMDAVALKLQSRNRTKQVGSL